MRRLGLPYVFGVLVLIPIAVYPAYLAIGGDPSLSVYLQHYVALPFLPNGQLWFLWQLLALNFVVVGLNWIAPDAVRALGRWSAAAGQRPHIYFSALIALSAIAYVPLALAFTPWAWSNSGLLSVQWCRPLLYGVYFFAGVGIGAAGIDVGLVAADGALGRRWKLWLGVAIASLFLWMGVTALTMNGPAPVVIEIAAALCFVLACAGGCFFVIASSLRFGTTPSSGLDSLSTNAYSLYLVHYDFVVWLQYALLGTALFALIKGVIVFCGTLILSWLTVLLRRAHSVWPAAALGAVTCGGAETPSATGDAPLCAASAIRFAVAHPVAAKQSLQMFRHRPRMCADGAIMRVLLRRHIAGAASMNPATVLIRPSAASVAKSVPPI